MSTTLPETQHHAPHPQEMQHQPTTEKTVPALPNELMTFLQSQLRWNNLDWGVIVWMTLVHVGCLFAPFYFNWSSFATACVLHWFTGSIGICMCYHRGFSHCSFKMTWPVKLMGLIAGVISGEGSPLMWCAVHRVHHARSDHPGDPHSPLEGFAWAHSWWLLIRHKPEQMQPLYQKYVPDMLQDKMVLFFDRTYAQILILLAVAFYAIGGLPLLLWGICVRMVATYHTTWFVNSATHIWGYRNYQTRDASRNLWWVAALAYGEGWHNNHHAHPHVAPAGHKWWEIDMTWMAIRLLWNLGLVSNVDNKIPTGTAAAEDA